jgi:hypothetical protein
MDPPVSLEIMIPVEALRALVALERAVIRRSARVARMRRVVTPIHLLHAGHMPAIEAWEEPRLQRRSQERHLPAGAMDIRHDGPGHRRERI